jgi:hypothetical protein
MALIEAANEKIDSPQAPLPEWIQWNPQSGDENPPDKDAPRVFFFLTGKGEYDHVKKSEHFLHGGKKDRSLLVLVIHTAESKSAIDALNTEALRGLSAMARVVVAGLGTFFRKSNSLDIDEKTSTVESVTALVNLVNVTKIAEVADVSEVVAEASHAIADGASLAARKHAEVTSKPTPPQAPSSAAGVRQPAMVRKLSLNRPELAAADFLSLSAPLIEEMPPVSPGESEPAAGLDPAGSALAGVTPVANEQATERQNEDDEYFDAEDDSDDFSDALDFISLSQMRLMETSDLLERVDDVQARVFCARSRVHDLCDISIVDGPLREASTSILLELSNEKLGRTDDLTKAQAAYLDGVLRRHKMLPQIRAGSSSEVFSSEITNLMSRITSDLVHPNYGHVEVWDVRRCTDMRDAFFVLRDETLDRLDLSFWDTRNMTNMNRAFQYAPCDVVVSTWDVRNVKHMDRMFADAKKFNGDVTEWDVGNVVSMGEMFHNATSFNGDMTRWNVGSVTDMEQMFASAHIFEGIGVSDWTHNSGVNVLNMFKGATNAKEDALEWQKRAMGTTYGRARGVRPRRGFV